MNTQLEQKNNEIKTRVRMAARILSAEYSEDRKGTPRIIAQGRWCKFSVVFLARSSQWKVFHPFPAESGLQKRLYFNDFSKMQRFLRSEGACL